MAKPESPYIDQPIPEFKSPISPKLFHTVIQELIHDKQLLRKERGLSVSKAYRIVRLRQYADHIPDHMTRAFFQAAYDECGSENVEYVFDCLATRAALRGIRYTDAKVTQLGTFRLTSHEIDLMLASGKAAYEDFLEQIRKSAQIEKDLYANASIEAFLAAKNKGSQIIQDHFLV